MNPPSSSRRYWIGILGLALAVRLVFCLGYWLDKPPNHDEREYWTLSGNVAAGKGLVYDDDHHEHFGRAPGYPVFLAAVRSFGGSFTAVKLVQSVLGVIGVAFTGMLAARAAGPQAGLVAAAIAAVFPPLVWMVGYMLSETLYSVLALGSTLLLWSALERSSRAKIFATGLAIGVTALVRPIALPFLALIVAWLVLGRRILFAATLVVGATLVIAPWAAWKTHESGRFILIASEGGITFWTGNHPLAIGEGDMAANPAIKRANEELRASHAGVSPDDLETVYYREAVSFLKSEPLHFLGLLPRKLFYLWVPVGPSYAAHSPLYRWSVRGSYLALTPFALVGFWVLVRRRVDLTPLWLLAGSVVVTCLVFFPQDRYRVPAIDPVLIVCAAALSRSRSRA